MSTTRKRVYGYLAEFKSASALYKAAEKVRDAGFSRWDVHSPFPIHGMDEAMGLKKQILKTNKGLIRIIESVGCPTIYDDADIEFIIESHDIST